mmetsp:Transcript_179703/g.569878  ORF Transcript_179703/g.569878 Transcript_179703/m.569878 type:complete len:284 (-) Transcript_179703:610-1461(-)
MGVDGRPESDAGDTKIQTFAFWQIIHSDRFFLKIIGRAIVDHHASFLLNLFQDQLLDRNRQADHHLIQAAFAQCCIDSDSETCGSCLHARPQHCVHVRAPSDEGLHFGGAPSSCTVRFVTLAHMPAREPPEQLPDDVKYADMHSHPLLPPRRAPLEVPHQHRQRRREAEPRRPARRQDEGRASALVQADVHFAELGHGVLQERGDGEGCLLLTHCSLPVVQSYPIQLVCCKQHRQNFLSQGDVQNQAGSAETLGAVSDLLATLLLLLPRSADVQPLQHGAHAF